MTEEYKFKLPPNIDRTIRRRIMGEITPEELAKGGTYTKPDPHPSEYAQGSYSKPDEDRIAIIRDDDPDNPYYLNPGDLESRFDELIRSELNKFRQRDN